MCVGREDYGVAVSKTRAKRDCCKNIIVGHRLRRLHVQLDNLLSRISRGAADEPEMFVRNDGKSLQRWTHRANRQRVTQKTVSTIGQRNARIVVMPKRTTSRRPRTIHRPSLSTTRRRRLPEEVTTQRRHKKKRLQRMKRGVDRLRDRIKRLTRGMHLNLVDSVIHTADIVMLPGCPTST